MHSPLKGLGGQISAALPPQEERLFPLFKRPPGRNGTTLPLPQGPSIC